MRVRYRHYDWASIEVDGCRIFRVSGISELIRLRTSAYTWAYAHERKFSILTVEGGIVFVVRHPDGEATVGSQPSETSPCPDDHCETRCKEWRLRVPTVRRSVRRRRLLSLPLARKSDPLRKPLSTQP